MLDNKVSDDCKTSGNYEGDIITNRNGVSLNAKQVRNYKVSGGVKISNDYNGSEIILNQDNGDTLSNSGDNENKMSVEVNQGLLVSVYELEKEWRDSLNVEYEQRANFSCGIGEGKSSQMLSEDKGSFRVFVGGKWSPKCPLIFCSLSGKARWCLDNFAVLPSKWRENVKLGWESDNKEINRVIELFRVSRDYEGLVGGINTERNDYIISNVDLPCAVVKMIILMIMINIHLLGELVYL